jgi:hypothetical protein
MKYLTNYTEQAQTDLFNETGAFWAFSNAQFAEKQQPGVTYVTIPGLNGLVCPKKLASNFVDRLIAIGEEGRKMDLQENGKEAIIKRELYNHECFYTGQPEDIYEDMKCYGFTEQDVRAVYVKELPNSDL